VIVTDVLREEGEHLAKEIGATFVAHDVRSEEEWGEVVRQTIEEHGRIDVLVNNAGIFHRAKLVGTDLETYRRIIDVNQIGVFLGMRAVAPDDRPGRWLHRQHLLGGGPAGGAVASPMGRRSSRSPA
jgi:3alpha(or 20beta)-hydroxysteroid dehydrogenase